LKSIYSYKIFISGLIFILLSDMKISAQSLLSNEQEGVQYSIIPVIGYNSDFGFVGGGLLQRNDYREGVSPFWTSTSAEFTASTKGHFITKIDYERLRSFGINIRSRYRFEGLRLLSTTYFGIGNDTEFSEASFSEGRYFFEDRTLQFQYWGRKNLGFYGDNVRIDSQLLGAVSYRNPVSTGEETIFAETAPPGAEGGWVNQIGIGIVIDKRESEVDPRSGFRFESNANFSGGLVGSDYNFSTFVMEARGYYSPFSDLVIAQKLVYRHAIGDTPFWELPVVGGDRGLRGYALNRFRGDSSILHILEMRSWLFSVLDDQIRIGAQAFMDTGRVFADDDRLGNLPSGLKQTFGFGGAMSILNPDFVFRGDVAFSDELYRIYFSFGFLF